MQGKDVCPRNLTVLVSNEMNEYTISRLIKKGAPVDVWGVGTNLVTGHPESALSGVYKLAALQTDSGWKAVYKTSDDRQKRNLPGIKQVYRYSRDGNPFCDVIGSEEGEPEIFYHKGRQVKLPAGCVCRPLQTLKMKEGTRTTVSPDINAIRQNTLRNLNALPERYCKLRNPAVYPVCISGDLQQMIR